MPTTRTSTCDTENSGCRNWSTLTAAEMDRVIKVYESGDQKAFAREAESLGTTPATLGRQVRATKMIRDRYRAQLVVAAVPESPSPVCNQYTIIETDDAIIISDIEVPDHDPRILRLAMLTGMRHGIKKLVLGGDIIATDQDALNTWLTTWAEDGAKTYAACLKELKELIRACAEWFSESIYAVMGNHDERLAKKTGGQVTIQMMMEGEPVNFSYYSYLYLYSPAKKEYTYLCHQYAYSKTPVRLAQFVWEVETAPDGSRSKMHIIVTHTHIEQTGWSLDGEWRCIGLGCMRDPARTKYARLRATKFSNL